MVSPGQRRRFNLLRKPEARGKEDSLKKERTFKFPIVHNGVVVGFNYFVTGAGKVVRLPGKALKKFPKRKTDIRKAVRQ